MTPSWLLDTSALSPAALNFYSEFAPRYTPEQHAQLADVMTDNGYLQQQWHFVLSHSQYFLEHALKYPDLVIDICQNMAAPLSAERIQSLHARFTTELATAKDLDNQLRLFRQRMMMDILWRDFCRHNATLDTTAQISLVADLCVQTALDFHHTALAKIYGQPRNREGQQQGLIVLGMGKLGAHELNLSSDIDLIFCFPENGQTDGEKRAIDNSQFFTQLGQKLIKSLDEVQQHGFVFRVDMRLRPYGQSGALACNFGSLEDYYQHQGREWERYAMIKSRIIAHRCESVACDELSQLLTAFTYRKYVDFSVIDALRNLKTMIVQEVKRRGLGDDVKLGAGGIREIEFIAQAFQLIRGGRETELQDNRITVILPLLEEKNCIPEGASQVLLDAYYFLRNSEHAIQGYNDQQTQKLPDDAQQQQKIAQVMGFSDWTPYYTQLNLHRQQVETLFKSVIADPNEDTDSDKPHNPWQDLWLIDSDQDNAFSQQLADDGHETPEQSAKVLQGIKQVVVESRVHPVSAQRLNQFMPLLLACIAHTETPAESLRRIQSLVLAVCRRSAYLLLLSENPNALAQLVRLAQGSPWIIDHLAAQPALLDELLDASTLFHLPSRSELEDDLRRHTLRIEDDDLEEQMDAIRYFRNAHALKVAACEITGTLPLMKVSDYLTHLAEVIVDYVVNYTWRTMVKKHGYPDGIVSEQARFLVVGYGKMGGIELGHGSDLDLVFLHNSAATGSTDGQKPIENPIFFARTGQKIIHFLTTNMPSGMLYEVDMRLRPSGNSGLLVASVESFQKYQKNEAWTWEHQALVRARAVAGDNDIAQQFNDVRLAILGQTRNLQTLRDDVIAMRKKMRDHLGSDKNNDDSHQFHIKHDSGGIVDIEFMVQYSVLAWSHSHPELVTYTDNIRILEHLANSGKLSAHKAQQLTDAYKTFRHEGHRLTLQQQPSLVDGAPFRALRDTVVQIWQDVLHTDAN